MTDTTYGPKVRLKSGGDVFEVAPGGAIHLGDTVVLSVNSAGTQILLTGLPTADPTVAGALYTNTGVLTVSAG
jgi:hypothetical protein